MRMPVVVVMSALLFAAPAFAWDLARGEDPITREKTAEIKATNGKSGAEALKVTVTCHSQDAGKTLISVIGGGPAANTDIAAAPKEIHVSVDARPIVAYEAVPIREPTGELSFTASLAAEPRIQSLLAEFRVAYEKITFDIQGYTYTMDVKDTGKTLEEFAKICNLTIPIP
ncbi:hypothetical protein BH10PSE7_BH10PSE7_38750 [soil metagenome]